MLSSWFVVDNTPPVIGFKRAGDAWLVTVEDALSRLVRVEWNRDADEWHALVPDDGLLDGRLESFHIAAQKGSHTLTVRAVDDHFNRVTVTVEELP